MPTPYDFKSIEAKWRSRWESSGIDKTPADPAKKYYVLEMFAYPSGDIHMGHFRNYTIGDVAARYRRMNGFGVLHPPGWDAFGLPAEQAAIKRNTHPRDWTLGNVETGKKTLQRMAISYDWDREVRTFEPDYYKWTEWLFLLLHRRGLAYQAPSLVNWCETDKTILANEQCQDGTCWRCGNPVVKKELENCWFFKYSAYSERLLKDLDRLDGWPEDTKQKQRNWIGRSEGCEIEFELEPVPVSVPVPGRNAGGPGSGPGTHTDTGTGTEKLTVFTTRPDTVWGVTFVVVAPEHPLAAAAAKTDPKVADYIAKALLKKEFERTKEGEKDGVPSGRFVRHPLTGARVPLFIADYVLAGYGTGVVMGVPAHDTRDFAFAKKYGLPIKVVIQPFPRSSASGAAGEGGPEGKPLDPAAMADAYVDAGVMTDSGEMTGTPSPSGIPKVIAHLAQKGLGRAKIQYRLKDWLVSRQRYWGAPIPIIHCAKCGPQPVPDKDLPVILPLDQKDFVPKGRSPLEDNAAYMKAACPKCGGAARRDPDTMDTFMCSSWYLFRYLDPKNAAEPWRKEEAKRWLPVDLYVGGAEHACMHLLYFRFITKVLHDAGWLPVDEPVVRLFHQGMVSDAKGEIMSKSKGNAVSPAEIMDRYGVDVCRLAMLFFAPSDAEIKWSEDGLKGAQRFVYSLWDIFEELVSAVGGGSAPRPGPPDGRGTEAPPTAISKPYKEIRRRYHVALKRATDAAEGDLAFNTVISAVMELRNAVQEARPLKPANDGEKAALREVAAGLARLLAPMAPFLGETFWEMAGGGDTVFHSGWPVHDPEALKTDELEIPVQVNGKLRSKLVVPAGIAPKELEALALKDTKVQEHLQGRAPKKVIVVPGKLVNVVG